jgi:hypothetical protein
MKLIRNPIVLILVVIMAYLPLFASEQNSKREAIYNLKAEFPGLKVYSENGRISRIYGKPFGFGSNPEESAEQFRQNYSQIYGVKAENLRAVSVLYDGRHTQPVMYNSDNGSPSSDPI